MARVSSRSSKSGSDEQVYQGATSGYGPTKGNSVGYMPQNPKAYKSSLEKAYKGSAENDYGKAYSK